MSGFQSFAASGYQSLMASGFQSFGAAGLGATIIMNWIDEAFPVYNPNGTEQWDEDLAVLEDRLDEATIGVVMGVFIPWPPGGSWQSCAPEQEDDAIRPCDRQMPDFVDRSSQVGRPPPLERFIDDFSALRVRLAEVMDVDDVDRVPLRTLMLDIDGSGSMGRSTIEPGIDEFQAWMAEHHPAVQILERVYSNERWLWQSAESLRLAMEDFEEDQP